VRAIFKFGSISKIFFDRKTQEREGQKQKFQRKSYKREGLKQRKLHKYVAEHSFNDFNCCQRSVRAAFA
jgi:hypothetical protein